MVYQLEYMFAVWYRYQYDNVHHNHIIQYRICDAKIIIKIGGEDMEKDKKLQEIARSIRNEKVREWRHKNKDKVKEINQRYWLKKAKVKLAEENKK